MDFLSLCGGGLSCRGWGHCLAVRGDASRDGHGHAWRMAHVDGVDDHARPEPGRGGPRISVDVGSDDGCDDAPLGLADAADLSPCREIPKRAQRQPRHLDARRRLFPHLAACRRCCLRDRAGDCLVRDEVGRGKPDRSRFRGRRVDRLRNIPAHAVEVCLPESLPGSARRLRRSSRRRLERRLEPRTASWPVLPRLLLGPHARTAHPRRDESRRDGGCRRRDRGGKATAAGRVGGASDRGGDDGVGGLVCLSRGASAMKATSRKGKRQLVRVTPRRPLPKSERYPL